jgi:hypothetical protein
VGGCDWIRAARWEKKEEEIGGERHRDLCPSEGTGARGTGDPAGPAASAATAEAESAARARAARAPPASLPSHLTAGNLLAPADCTLTVDLISLVKVGF